MSLLLSEGPPRSRGISMKRGLARGTHTGRLCRKYATGQSLAYVYAREMLADADIANVLTMDEARRIASNIAKLPALLGATKESEVDFPEGGG